MRSPLEKMAAMGLCKKDGDPSLLFSNPAPPARQETWREGEVVRLVKRAIRIKYPGLACAIAIAWDTQLSPVDVRKLTPAKMKADGLGSVFHVGRAKTGRAAFGTLSARTERLIRWYLGGLGFEIHVEAPLLRTRGDLRRQRGRYHQGGDRGSGRPGMPRPYTQNKLGQDFRKVRAAVFPGTTGRWPIFGARGRWKRSRVVPSRRWCRPRWPTRSRRPTICSRLTTRHRSRW
jgi:hypothetical protein